MYKATRIVGIWLFALSLIGSPLQIHQQVTHDIKLHGSSLHVRPPPYVSEAATMASRWLHDDFATGGKKTENTVSVADFGLSFRRAC